MMGLWLTVLALLGSVRCEESEGNEAIAPEMPTFDVFLSEATGKTFTYELFAGLCIGMFLVSAPFLIPVTYERFEKKRIVYAKCVPSSTALSLVLMLMMVGTVSRIVAWMIDILNIETVFNWILSKGIAGKGGLLYGGYKVGKTMFDYIFTTTLLGVDSTKPEEETSPEQMAQGSLELLLMATEAEVDSKIKEEAEEFYKALLIFVTADEDVATIAQGDLKEALGWSTANELIWLTMSEAMCNFFEEGLGWKWTKKLANMWRPMGKTPRSKARRNLQVASFTFFRGLWAKLSMWEKTIAGFVLGMIIFVFYFVWVGKILNTWPNNLIFDLVFLAIYLAHETMPHQAFCRKVESGIRWVKELFSGFKSKAAESKTKDWSSPGRQPEIPKKRENKSPTPAKRKKS